MNKLKTMSEDEVKDFKEKERERELEKQCRINKKITRTNDP